MFSLCDFSRASFSGALILAAALVTGCSGRSGEEARSGGSQSAGQAVARAPGADSSADTTGPGDSLGITPATGKPLGPEKRRDHPTMSMDEVKVIMDRHAPGLMKIEGVVGVAIGALPDGALCIQVLTSKSPHQVSARIPRSIDGVPVVIIETGEIRPMGG